MTIFDYTFVRLYIWYKRRYDKYDHKKLVSSAASGLAGYSVFIGLELMISLAEFFNTPEMWDEIGIWGIIIMAISVFIFMFYYDRETSAEIYIKQYEDLDEAQHTFFKRKTRFIIFLIQILCASLVGHRIILQ